MHHGDVGDVLQRERPIDGRIAATGDDHALAPQVLTAADVILNGAAGLIGRETFQGRAIRAERPCPGRHNDCFGPDRVALVGCQREGAARAAQPVDLPAEQPGRPEWGDLRLQTSDQGARLNRRIRRNVIDRLFRIQRCALAANFRQSVDQHAGHFEHTELEDGEQADGAGADDGYVGFDGLCHAPPV